MKIYGVYMDRPLSAGEEDRMMAAVSAEKRENAGAFTIRRMLTAP